MRYIGSSEVPREMGVDENKLFNEEITRRSGAGLK